MRNLWIQRDAEVAAWYANITPVTEDPSRLLRLVEDLVGAGEDQKIFVREAPPSSVELRRRWEEKAEVDADLSRGQQASAHMAWYDATDQVVEGL